MSKSNKLPAITSGRIIAFSILFGMIFLFLLANYCFASDCTKHGTATGASSVVESANDVNGIEGRHFLMLQNTGSNNMNVAIGSNNNATSSDIQITPGNALVLFMQGLKMVPGGDVAVISVSGTTWGFCDY